MKVKIRIEKLQKQLSSQGWEELVFVEDGSVPDFIELDAEPVEGEKPKDVYICNLGFPHTPKSEHTHQFSVTQDGKAYCACGAFVSPKSECDHKDCGVQCWRQDPTSKTGECCEECEYPTTPNSNTPTRSCSACPCHQREEKRLHTCGGMNLPCSACADHSKKKENTYYTAFINGGYEAGFTDDQLDFLWSVIAAHNKGKC